MSNIKKALSELRGALGGYGFAQPEMAEKQLSESDDDAWILGHLLDGLAAGGDRSYDDAMVNVAKLFFGFTPSGAWPGQTNKVREKLTRMRGERKGDKYAVAAIDAMLQMVQKAAPEPEAEA
jgi:hypothetical protein